MTHISLIVLLMGGFCYLHGNEEGNKYPWLTAVCVCGLLTMAHGFGLERFGFGRVYLLYMVLSLWLMLLSVHDLKGMVLPVALLVVGAVFGAGALLLYRVPGWYLQLGISLLVLMLGLGMSKLLRGGLGEGDVIVFAVLTLYLGWVHMVTVVMGALTLTALFGLGLMIFGGKGRKTMVPFLPFLTLVHLGVVWL